MGEWRTGRGTYTGKPCVVAGCESPLRDHPICGKCKLKIRTRKMTPIPGVYEIVNPECKEPRCGRVSNRQGLCDSHYNTHRKRSNNRGPHQVGGPCRAPNCELPSTSHGTCPKHRRVQRKYNIPDEDIDMHWKHPVCQNLECGRTDNLHVDHDHATGEFRGFLCAGCNVAIGHLLESPRRAKGLIEYMVIRGINDNGDRKTGV